MRDMANHTERAVSTLLEVDPGFQELCDTLYGGAIDAEEIWNDVFGKAATATDTAARRDKLISGVGAGIGVASSAIGVGEGVKAVRSFRGGNKGRAAYETGKAGVLLGGDVLGTLALKERAKGAQPTKGKLVPVAKGLVAVGTPTQSQQNAGALKAAKSTMAAAKPKTGTLQPVGAMGMARRPNPVAYSPMKPQTPGTPSPGGAGPMAKRDDFEAEGVFSKFDDDKRVAFGYASVVKHNGMPVVDKQGDYISAEDLEDAAYRYVLSSRVGGDMHRRTPDDRPHHTSDLIESTVFTEEKCLAMGMPAEVAKAMDGRWWIGMKVHDDEAWSEVKKGNRQGFSIHGRGKRVDHDLDELMYG